MQLTCVIFVIATLVASALSLCPNIIARSQWDADPALSTPLEVQPATHVVLHHSSTPTCTTSANCAALVRSIQRVHMRRKKYQDIGYNFLIGEDGNIYEGVGWGKQGTHAGPLDSKSLGICIIGDYTSWLPNAAALNALKTFLECAVQHGQLRDDYKLITHRQLKHTDCPGQKLYNHMRSWDNWVAGP